MPFQQNQQGQGRLPAEDQVQLQLLKLKQEREALRRREEEIARQVCRPLGHLIQKYSQIKSPVGPADLQDKICLGRAVYFFTISFIHVPSSKRIFTVFTMHDLFLDPCFGFDSGAKCNVCIFFRKISSGPNLIKTSHLARVTQTHVPSHAGVVFLTIIHRYF